jgi:hypothetical protein
MSSGISGSKPDAIGKRVVRQASIVKGRAERIARMRAAEDALAQALSNRKANFRRFKVLARARWEQRRTTKKGVAP